MFEVGQMVVCVDDGWDSQDPDEKACAHPVKDIIYTIRGFSLDDPDSVVGVFLEEIVNPPLDYGEFGWVEMNWNIERFRPVRKTSIEELRKLVAPVKDRERVS